MYEEALGFIQKHIQNIHVLHINIHEYAQNASHVAMYVMIELQRIRI